MTNAIEMGKGAAVYEITSRFNHSCVPNAFFTWNGRIQKETVHAIKDIAEGEVSSPDERKHDHEPSGIFELAY